MKHADKRFYMVLALVISIMCGTMLVTPVYASTAGEPSNNGNDNGITMITLEDGSQIAEYSGVDGGISLVEPTGSKKYQPSITPYSLDYNGSNGPRYYLHLSFQTQQNYYYCGPAAVRMVLAYCGFTYSQDTIAGWLGTTTNGTAAGNNVSNVMNNVCEDSPYGFAWVWQTDSTETSTFRSHCFADLATSAHLNPIVANTLECDNDGQVFLEGHGGFGNLAHFGVVNGITSSGEHVTYTDPGYGMYDGFEQEQQITVTDMCRALGNRGYVW